MFQEKEESWTASASELFFFSILLFGFGHLPEFGIKQFADFY